MSDLASSCEVCQSVSHAIDDYYESMKDSSIKGTLLKGRLPPGSPEDQQLLALGSLENLKGKSDCTSCQDILPKIVRDGAQVSSHSELYFESNPQGLYIRPLEGQKSLCLNLYRLGTSKLAYENGRTFDSQQADITLLRK